MDTGGTIMGRPQFQIKRTFCDPCRMFVHATEAGDEILAGHQVCAKDGFRGMGFAPMIGYFDASRGPDALDPADVFYKSFQRLNTPRTPDQAAVQTDRHHLGITRRTFRIESVESIAQVGIELVSRIEALRGGKPHVVAIQRIGDDQLVAPRDPGPVWQIIVVGVGDIVEPPDFGCQRHRVD